MTSEALPSVSLREKRGAGGWAEGAGRAGRPSMGSGPMRSLQAQRGRGGGPGLQPTRNGIRLPLPEAKRLSGGPAARRQLASNWPLTGLLTKCLSVQWVSGAKRGCCEPVRRQWWRGGGSNVDEWDEGEGTTKEGH